MISYLDIVRKVLSYLELKLAQYTRWQRATRAGRECRAQLDPMLD
jgi:hypothetical protein